MGDYVYKAKAQRLKNVIAMAECPTDRNSKGEH